MALRRWRRTLRPVPTSRRIATPPPSREFVDGLLTELRSAGFSAAGWRRLWWDSLRRSEEQALAHPVAAREVHLLHMLAAPFVSGPWNIASWWMSWTHLGLLGDADVPLGWPNRLTILRGLLPALLPAAGPLPAVLAMATDFADGRLARGQGQSSALGAFADPLADSLFWTWFALREEPNRTLKALSLLLWLGPTAGLTLAYFTRARALGIPSRISLRPISAAMQVLLTVRSVRRRLRRR